MTMTMTRATTTMMTTFNDDSAVLGVAALTHRLTELEVGDTGGTEDHGYDRRGPRERAELFHEKRRRDERRHQGYLSVSIYIYLSLSLSAFVYANAVYIFSFNTNSRTRTLYILNQCTFFFEETVLLE